MALSDDSEGLVASESGAGEQWTVSHELGSGSGGVCSSGEFTDGTSRYRREKADFADGQISLPFETDARPLATRLRYRGAPIQVLILGGGDRDGGRFGGLSPEGEPRTRAYDRTGNALYIVDAASGELIWKAVRGPTGSVSNTVYQHADLGSSLSSKVTALHSGSGVAHRLYLADTGGNVWRVDLPQGDAVDHRRDNWSLSRLARLGGGRQGDRRFFSAPEVVESVDRHGEFDGVLIASGDREHPGRYGVDNYLFYLKDRLVNSGDRLARSRAPVTAAELPDRTDCASTDSCALPLDKGWKLQLRLPGEKGLATPLVDAGRVYLPTFVPARGGGGCPPAPGRVLLYRLNLADASRIDDQPRARELASGVPVQAVAGRDRIYFPRVATVLDSVSSVAGRWASLRRRSDVPHMLSWRPAGFGKAAQNQDNTHEDGRVDAP